MEGSLCLSRMIAELELHHLVEPCFFAICELELYVGYARYVN